MQNFTSIIGAVTLFTLFAFAIAIAHEKDMRDSYLKDGNFNSPAFFLDWPTKQ